MKLDTPKDLKKIIDLCRKAGIDAIEIDNVKIAFGHKPEMPFKRSNSPQAMRSPDEAVQVPGFTGALPETDKTIPSDDFDSLTDEQKLLWSAQGHVENE